jgi:CO/xanthine dehydrogenase FAD-binding subunit
MYLITVHRKTQTRNYFRPTSSEGQQSLEVLQRILCNLATPQLRNVATMGGTVMWGHAASDILPLLRHRVFHVVFFCYCF